jgi:LysR family transcriptional regulator for bpeEF and oprC
LDKLRAMEIFCRVVETGSFAAAAAVLDVVPSAVSKTVAALEKELGFRLLNRSTRGFSMTDEGRAYHEECRDILQRIEAAEAKVRLGPSEAVGKLRVGMHPALRAMLLDSMGAFLEMHPGLIMETMITNTPSAVINDAVDVVLHVGRLPDSALGARRLGVTRAVTCAAPAYLDARPTPRHPRELAAHAAVIYARRDEEPNLRWRFAKGRERCEIEIAPRAILRDGIGLVDVLVGGGGVGRPFELSVRRWLKGGQLRALCADWTSELHPISAVLPVAGRPSARVRAYLEHVVRTLDSE